MKRRHAERLVAEWARYGCTEDDCRELAPWAFTAWPKQAKRQPRKPRALLEDEEWSEWSNVEIARRCAVSDELVRKVRHETSLPTVGSEPPPPRTYTTKHGTTATMNTAGLIQRPLRFSR